MAKRMPIVGSLVVLSFLLIVMLAGVSSAWAESIVPGGFATVEGDWHNARR